MVLEREILLVLYEDIYEGMGGVILGYGSCYAGTWVV